MLLLKKNQNRTFMDFKTFLIVVSCEIYN